MWSYGDIVISTSRFINVVLIGDWVCAGSKSKNKQVLFDGHF